MVDFDKPSPPPVTVSRSQGLIARVQAILLRPVPTWDEIAAEPGDVKSIYMGYVIPLAAIPPVAAAIGTSVIGVGAFGFSYHTPIVLAIVQAVITYVLGLVMLYVQALIIDWLAPQFDGQKNLLAAFKLAAYSMTAFWIAGIFGLVPMLAWVGIVGLYSIYLFYLGVPKLMKTPPEKTIIYMIVCAVAGAIASIIPGLIAGGIVATLGLGTLGVTHLGSVATVNGVTSTQDRVTGTVAGVDLGKLQQATEQMAAEASAQQNGTSTIKLADANALLDLMPQAYMGATRADTSTSSGGVGGVAASTATATYHIGDGSITLEVSDIGTLGGMTGLAGALNLNSTSSSAGGYSKVTTVNGQMVTEDYNTDSKSGKYAVVNNGRITVSAEGNGVDMNAMKSLVASVDVGKAQALTK